MLPVLKSLSGGRGGGGQAGPGGGIVILLVHVSSDFFVPVLKKLFGDLVEVFVCRGEVVGRSVCVWGRGGISVCVWGRGGREKCLCVGERWYGEVFVCGGRGGRDQGKVIVHFQMDYVLFPLNLIFQHLCIVSTQQC